jgi:hypothetical protein
MGEMPPEPRFAGSYGPGGVISGTYGQESFSAAIGWAILKAMTSEALVHRFRTVAGAAYVERSCASAGAGNFERSCASAGDRR